MFFSFVQLALTGNRLQDGGANGQGGWISKANDEGWSNKLDLTGTKLGVQTYNNEVETDLIRCKSSL